MTLLLTMLACSGGTDFTYSGYPMDDFFPFDGERTWTFRSEDETVVNTVVATLNPTAENPETGLFVYAMDYTLGCRADAEEGTCTAGDPFRISQIRWSADQSRGTLIHSFTEDGTTTNFSPPLVITEDQGVPDEQWVTETDQGTFTSTFDQIGDCPVMMDVDWDECVRILVDDDGDPATPGTHPMHGVWYAVAGFNVIAFQLNDDAALWQLSNATHNPS